jgi:hypothetical protein
MEELDERVLNFLYVQRIKKTRSHRGNEETQRDMEERGDDYSETWIKKTSL